MPSFTCPNDGAPMESDVDPIRQAPKGRLTKHICATCGYVEKR